MADIRIKDLATTASVTASDDFMAVDGVTNGTRKLSAATPSFATSVTTPSLTSPASTNLTLGLGTGGTALTLTNSTLAATFASDLSLVGDEKYLTLHSDNTVGSNGRARFRAVGSGGGSGYGGSFVLDTRTPSNSYVTALSIDSSQAATFAGAVTIGNTVNTVSPTSPNRTITMVVGGVTLYIAAKTTND